MNKVDDDADFVQCHQDNQAFRIRRHENGINIAALQSEFKRVIGGKCFDIGDKFRYVVIFSVMTEENIISVLLRVRQEIII